MMEIEGLADVWLTGQGINVHEGDIDEVAFQR
jgi:hypothetical protein